jgi:heat shock protein HspQ
MSESITLYKLGQIIRHKKYEYRGVIVKIDEECRASNAWYEANQTKPSRDQPWYHILVSEINQVTYAAQSNLVPDESCEKIEHPLIPIFFYPYKDGHYPRNNRPWPSNELL